MQSYLFESLRDHTFGDLDDPIIGAAYQRKRNTGVHHYGQKCPLMPKPDEQVQLVATTFNRNRGTMRPFAIHIG